MDWRQVVKVLAIATQILTAVFLVMILGGGVRNDEDAAIIAVLMLSVLVLVLNLAKPLRPADTELSTLKQELEKAELRLKLHRLNVQSREKT